MQITDNYNARNVPQTHRITMRPLKNQNRVEKHNPYNKRPVKYRQTDISQEVTLSNLGCNSPLSLSTSANLFCTFANTIPSTLKWYFKDNIINILQLAK